MSTILSRRDFIGAVAALAAAGLALAQPSVRLYRIGILSQAWSRERLSALLNALSELGYVEGRNTRFDIQYANGRTDLLANLADELVARKVDLIVAIGNVEILAAKHATSSIPIVMVVSSAPVETGLIDSLSRPGGNVTGTTLQAPEIAGKFLELLKETVPNLKQVALLWDPDYPGLELYRLEAERAARALGIELTLLPIRTLADLEGAFARLAADRPHALFVSPTGPIYDNRARVVAFAARERLPAIYASKVIVSEGGLMSYIADFDLLARRDAAIIDRIFKGARPSDLPVEQPTRYELVINLKTAKALGLAIPANVLARADLIFQ
jgi:putative ABC transport system substrate-binding protein